MHLTLAQVTDLLGTVLTIVTVVAGLLAKYNRKLKYVQAVLTAIGAAEKAVDRAAYNDDGSFNKARLDMAIGILAKLVKGLDQAKAEADIEAVLAVIHAHAAAAAAPAK
jgi:hypothetical protein